MKYMSSSVLIVASLTLAACSDGSPDGSPSLSDLKFERIDKNLGEVYQQHTYDLDFPFEVDGDDAIIISEIDTSCGCTDAFIYPAWDTETYGDVWPLNQPIPAGAKGSVRAVFDGSRYKRDKSSTITLRGNFLERKATLGVKAFVKPVFDVQPQNINFGEIITSALIEKSPEKMITITAMKDYEIERWVRVPTGIEVNPVGEVTELEGGAVSQGHDLGDHRVHHREPHRVVRVHESGAAFRFHERVHLGQLLDDDASDVERCQPDLLRRRRH